MPVLVRGHEVVDDAQVSLYALGAASDLECAWLFAEVPLQSFADPGVEFVIVGENRVHYDFGRIRTDRCLQEQYILVAHGIEQVVYYRQRHGPLLAAQFHPQLSMRMVLYAGQRGSQSQPALTII